MDKEVLAKAFNRWMDEYTNNPDAFDDIHKTAMRHLIEKLGGKEPTYGESCAALLLEYIYSNEAGAGQKSMA